MSNKSPRDKMELVQQNDNDSRKKNMVQHVSLSPFAAPSWGNGHGSQKSNIRIVARIRPLLVNKVQDGSVTAIFSESIQEVEAKNTSTVESPSLSLKEASSVAGIAAKFNSPLSKPLTPVQSPMKSYSPSKRLYYGKISTDKNIESPSHPIVASRSIMSGSNLGKVTKKLTVGFSNPVEFDYDAVLDSSSSQEDVYDKSIGDAIRRNIFRGFNTTVIATGTPQSGKSYTMYGTSGFDKKSSKRKSSIRTYSPNKTAKVAIEQTAGLHCNTDNETHIGELTQIFENDGITLRAINDLFLTKERCCSGGEVTIDATLVEIKNDNVFDLLNKRKTNVSNGFDASDNRAKAKRRQSSIRLTSIKQARQVLDEAMRKCDKTGTSHTICSLKVVINPAVKSSVTKGKLASFTSTDIISATLSLVDLAGRCDECKDLLVLERCISALSEKKNSPEGNIPFNDSSLTRMLRGSLGGNCCTVFFCCVSPSESDIKGSLRNLRTVERAGFIQNSIKRNVIRTKILTPAEGAALRRENKILKSKIQSLSKNLRVLGRGKIVFDSDESECGRAKSDSDVKIEEFRTKLRERLMLPLSQFHDGEEFEDSSSNQNSSKQPSTFDASSLLGLGDSDVEQEDETESIHTLASLSTDFSYTFRKNINGEIITTQKELKRLIALTLEWRSTLESQQKQRDIIDEQIMERQEEKMRFERDIESKTKELVIISDEKKSQLNHITNLRNDLVVEREEKMRHQEQIDNLKKENVKLRDQLSSVHDEKVEKKKRKSLDSGLRKTTCDKKPRLSLQNNYAKNLQEANHPSKPPLHLKTKLPERFQDDFSAMSSLSVSGIIDKRNLVTISSNEIAADDVSDISETNSLTTEQRAIRIHAKKLLVWADRTIENQCSSSSRTSIDTNSVISDLSSSNDFHMFSSSSGKENSNPNFANETRSSEKKNAHQGLCSCSESIFSGKAEHVEFFLPRLGQACTCGAEPNAECADSTALSSFLRSWQVTFLNACGITTAERLVEINKHYAKPVAKAMKKWRRKKKMKPAHTKSCLIALSIWAKTATTKVQSLNKQPHSCLEINYCNKESSDADSVSTLGNCSIRQVDMSVDEPLMQGEFEI